jgi:hypothetical protein
MSNKEVKECSICGLEYPNHKMDCDTRKITWFFPHEAIKSKKNEEVDKKSKKSNK